MDLVVGKSVDGSDEKCVSGGEERVVGGGGGGSEE